METIRLSNNTPVSLRISYDVTQDSKDLNQIDEAKFFLALNKPDADSKYFLASTTLGTLQYSNGEWTVDIGQGDLDDAIFVKKPFIPVLAIKYNGDTDFREIELQVNGEDLRVIVESGYAE